jgi:hypothetical protein
MSFFGRLFGRSPTSSWETGAHSHAANNLILYADNTGELYNAKIKAILTAAKFLGKGTYTDEGGTKLWLHWINEAAKRYKREFGSDAEPMSPAARRDAAAVVAAREYRRLLSGEYRDLLTKAQWSPGWRKQPLRHARAAKLGHRRHQRRYSHSPVSAASLKRLGYEYWRRQPTLESGHFDNLVYSDGKHRVWVSRASVADYGGDRRAWLAERLVVEALHKGRWEKV